MDLGSRLNWLRAGVLGANDGIVSTASIVMGVSGAALSDHALLASGIAGLVAGALSMAAGEYVSVSTQRDAEEAAIAAGVDVHDLTNPWHAALASLVSFVAGAIIPLLTIILAPDSVMNIATAAATTIALAITGAVSAHLGNARIGRAVLRNVVWGNLAMLVTYAVGVGVAAIT